MPDLRQNIQARHSHLLAQQLSAIVPASARAATVFHARRMLAVQQSLIKSDMPSYLSSSWLSFSYVTRLSLLRCVSDITPFNHQVTGASGFVGSHVVEELLRQGYSVRGCAYILYAYTLHSLVTVVSAVRSHNVARISKNYESFGDRFTTTIIDDLITSDLSSAVKGL